MKKKKKGILIWFEMDKRIEFLQPFISMSDEIEFVHLFFRTREERQIKLSPFEIIYWFDYKTPYQLIKKHNPDFIIGATEGLLIISLIAAAKEKNIPFYGLQHGFTTENLATLFRKIKRGSLFSVSLLKKHFYTTRFYFASLKLKNIGTFFQYINLFILFYSKFPEEAIGKNRYKWVKPACYICFSEISCIHYKELYDLDDSEIKFIGIPAFDEFFREISVLKPDIGVEKYFILIDTCFVDYHKPISPAQIQRCYQTIATYCRDNNAKLYIKIHPRNYENPDLVNDDTINFIRNMDMATLAKVIVNSAGCFGFYSTLTMPIAFTKPTIQIKFDDIVEPSLAANNITPVLDFYTFQVNDIQFYPFGNIDETLRRKFLFATDGNSAERLKQILLN
jgi:hypothetical protein